MPPKFLLDINSLDLDQSIFDVNDIEAINPQRYEFRMLDGITHFDAKKETIAGFKDVREDEFWVRGHIPGRPLFPGVLMIECAAQLASFAAAKVTGESRFIAFGGIEKVKFRAQVTPGKRLYLLGKFLETRPRRFKLAAQGIVQDQLAFEAVVIGMPIPNA